MTNKNTTMDNHINTIITYDSKYRLAICQPCSSVLPKSDKSLANHIRIYHNTLSKEERTRIETYINALDTIELNDFINELDINTEIEAIEGLPTEEVVRCNICQIIAKESMMINHSKINIDGQQNKVKMKCI